MVAVRVPRYAIEVLESADPFFAVNRMDVEILSEEDGSAQVRVPRFAMEVLMQSPRNQQVNRIDVEVLTAEDGTAEVQVPRFGMEVLETPPRTQQINRIDIEILTAESGTAAVRVPRFAIEALMRSGPTLGTLLPYPTGIDYGRHNWVSPVSLETAYMTDITESVRTLAEDRTGLLEKPTRMIDLSWLRWDRAALDRLYVTLRRATDEQTVVPLACDMTCTSATSLSGTTTLNCDTRWRRFFGGGRIVIFPASVTPYVSASQAKVYTIANVTPAALILTGNLGETWPAGSLVFPLISTEVVLEPSLIHEAARVANLSITMREVLGDSCLPPTMTGHPDGFLEVEGHPVLDIPQNWINGIETSYRRAGERYGAGRSARTYKRGPRYYQVQDYRTLFFSRQEFWRLLQLFDSRRGRLRPFVAVDQECIWEVVSVTSSFVEVSALGTFADFVNAMTFFGIVMKDGTHHVRRVNTVQDLGATWRITTTGDNWPSITLANIARAARARLSRFESDALKEDWDTLEVVRANFTIREILNERERSIDP